MPVSEKLRSATFKHIEAELYAFNDTKKEIRKLREEVIFGVNNDDENVGGGRSNYPGRPTELIATRLATNRKLRNLEEVVQAIETAYSQVTEDHRKIIKLRYWSNLNLTWDSIADRCNMHRNTATKYRKDFVLIVADKIGWL